MNTSINLPPSPHGLRGKLRATKSTPAGVLAVLLGLAFSVASDANEYDYLYPIDPVFEVSGEPHGPPLVRVGALNVPALPVPVVDVNSRESVAQFYAAMWAHVQFPDLAQHWSGSYERREPGDISATWRGLVLSRLNAYRALAGVPLFDGTRAYWDAYAQDAAFAMSANNWLGHFLTRDVAPNYWTHRAAVGAVRSNLAVGYGAKNSFLTIDGLIAETGENEGVGHRFSLLAPRGGYVGIGHVPFWNNNRVIPSANDAASSGAVMVGVDWTMDLTSTPVGTRRDRFVTWPNRGYSPVELLTTARWSVAGDVWTAEASFASAEVELYQDGRKIPTSVSARSPEQIVFLVDPAQRTGGIHPWSRNTALPLPDPTDYPAFPSRDVRFTVRVRNLKRPDGGPLPDYVYSTTVFEANAPEPGGKSATLVAVPELEPPQMFDGSAVQVLSDVRHPNGNIYDQLLLTGTATTFRADPGQITRCSFIDLNDDIVQVEFSGRGRVHVVLDAASGPALPSKYDQGVSYMKGHARIYVVDTDETSHLSVFSVGKANATNTALFPPGTQYDGVADIALIAIAAESGKMGGFYGGNAGFFASEGFTGVYAPGMGFQTGIFRVHDIAARGDAIPVLLTGAVAEVAITGGSLEQPNGWPLALGDAATVALRDGATSHAINGADLPQQVNAAKIIRNDVDVTTIVVR